MTRDLHAAIRTVLSTRGPSTCSEIAAAVRARYIDVQDTLTMGAFQTASLPEHGNPRATYWEPAPVASQAVPCGVTDTDWLAQVLSDGEWHPLDRIIDRSQRERGHGLTVHSRAADLRKRGLTVQQRSERVGRRVRSFYRVVSLDEPSVIPCNDGVQAVRGIEGSSSETVQAAASPLEPVSLQLFSEAAA